MDPDYQMMVFTTFKVVIVICVTQFLMKFNSTNDITTNDIYICMPIYTPDHQEHVKSIFFNLCNNANLADDLKPERPNKHYDLLYEYNKKLNEYLTTDPADPVAIDSNGVFEKKQIEKVTKKSKYYFIKVIRAKCVIDLKMYVEYLFKTNTEYMMENRNRWTKMMSTVRFNSLLAKNPFMAQNLASCEKYGARYMLEFDLNCFNDIEGLLSKKYRKSSSDTHVFYCNLSSMLVLAGNSSVISFSEQLCLRLQQNAQNFDICKTFENFKFNFLWCSDPYGHERCLELFVERLMNQSHSKTDKLSIRNEVNEFLLSLECSLKHLLNLFNNKKEFEADYKKCIDITLNQLEKIKALPYLVCGSLTKNNTEPEKPVFTQVVQTHKPKNTEELEDTEELENNEELKVTEELKIVNKPKTTDKHKISIKSNNVELLTKDNNSVKTNTINLCKNNEVVKEHLLEEHLIHIFDYNYGLSKYIF